MTSRGPVDPLTSRYDAFLFAPLSGDESAASLSVLSALARLNVDPWQEAELLAGLPTQEATRRLTSLLESLPDQTLAAGDASRLAEGMITLLPTSPQSGEGSAGVRSAGVGSADIAPDGPSGRANRGTGTPTARWVVLYVVVMAILIGTEYVMSNRPSSEEPVNTVIEDTRPDNQPATPSSNADP